MIVFKEVLIKKGENPVCFIQDLQINPNENVGIYGESGSGKSSFLDAVAGKLFSFSGVVEKPPFSQVSLLPRDYSFQKMVGAAFQYYQQRYHAHDSEIGPTLREVLQGQMIPVGTVNLNSVNIPPPKYPEHEIMELAQNLRVNHLLERKVTSLSNGETRRSLLCYALLKKPSLLLLDQPFTGLDISSKKLLKQLLEEISIPFILVSSPKDWPSNIHKAYFFDGKGVCEKTLPLDPIEIKMPKIELNENHYLKEENEAHVIFSIQNGGVKYGGKWVLKNINWQVINGDRWALLGANGSGKTTLLSLLLADNPQAYQNKIITFDQERGSGESIWDIKHRIGYISPEMQNFFPKRQVVWKIIASGLFDTIGLIHKLSSNHTILVNEVILLLHLSHIKDRSFYELSTGEQRMVLLARAVVKNPAVLVLDEPCQNLDYAHMVYFRNLVDQLVKETGKTLVYVTHNPEELPGCVNKYLYLESGQEIKRVE